MKLHLQNTYPPVLSCGEVGGPEINPVPNSEKFGFELQW